MRDRSIKSKLELLGIDTFVGKSKTIQRILFEVRQLQSVSRTSVLIFGESGTGKELIARAIHFGGKRTGPFIPLNCSAIPEQLAESTLFGHVPGAFTGANTSRRGYFELADGGTLFLDEIEDMSLKLQANILRVIEDGYVMPVGGIEEKHVDVRIIATTNQNLLNKIAQGTFRKDLFFRLERSTITVPPLRERKEDIPLLTEHFLSMFSEEMGIPKPEIETEAKKALEGYHFPGNVRELKNIIENALIKSRDSGIKLKHLHFINVSDLPAAPTATTPQMNQSKEPDAIGGDEPPKDRKRVEELMIQRVRKPSGGQVKETAHTEITDEEKILAYLKEHGSISNPECRDLLSVNRHRATYLVKKIQRYGLLVHEGEHRWSRYHLP